MSINTLRNFMEIICELGGLKGIYTNHSRKQRRATQIYMAGVDEQEILAKSGHMYEKKNRAKIQAVVDKDPTEGSICLKSASHNLCNVFIFKCFENCKKRDF